VVAAPYEVARHEKLRNARRITAVKLEGGFEDG